MTLALAVPADDTPRASRPRRILLADSDVTRRGPLEHGLAAPLAMTVMEVESPTELEDALRHREVDVVVATARLGAESTLQILARLRAAGDRTPFIVYSALHESLMRVLVSDTEGALLSSRVMNLPDLVDMAHAFVDRRRGARG